MKIINKISTRVYQTLFIGFGLVSIISIWKLSGPEWSWECLAISISLETGRSLYIKSRKSEVEEKQDMLFRLFFYGIRVVIVILLVVGLTGCVAIVINSDCGSCAIYKALGLLVIILWTCVFMGYFLWSLYFYNVNLGLTKEEWDKIKKEKAKKDAGQRFCQDIIDQEPKCNPCNDQTFGLPSGTVRGMIAFTLLFGAIALLVVSIGIKNTTEETTLVRDQFEFFKNAFLMMIAFYFGSRSLESLTKDSRKQEVKGDQTTPPPMPTVKSDDVIVNFIDPMQKPI